jgi:DnaK suppressor protein
MATIKSRSGKIPRGGRNGSTRQKLLELRRRVLGGISARGLSHASPSADIGDVVDQAVDEQDKGLSLLLTGREKGKLRAVQEALDKVDEGTYGICEDCGDPIGPGRLKAMPLARLCVTCQSQWEEELKSPSDEEIEPEPPGLDFERGIGKEEE